MKSTRDAIHKDPDFRDLLLDVSAASGGKISPEFVEKDYWVTRTLATLVGSGLDVWFKGGTALAKGFGAVRRFSEDLDLKILGTPACPLPSVESWTSQGKKATADRTRFFQALKEHLAASGLSPEFSGVQDEAMRAANIECTYLGAFKDRLSHPFKPFILLEVGSARVTPFVSRRISSFVHDFLERGGLLDGYDDPRPIVRCIHPLVTLIEKLDAIGRYYHRDVDDFQPERFVRHYDDAAAVAAYLSTPDGRTLPLTPNVESGEGQAPKALAMEMLASKDIRTIPSTLDDAFSLQDQRKHKGLEAAHAAIGPMYWGERTTLNQACESIRAWIARDLA